MKQPYIGNTKINKLYKGSELWCNWKKTEPEKPDIPTSFETIIFCQKNNNINQNGKWSLSSYTCYTGTKSLYEPDVATVERVGLFFIYASLDVFVSFQFD